MNKEVALIAAVGADNVIGLDGKLPWSVPEDLDYFHKVAGEYFVKVMGTNTYSDLFLSKRQEQDALYGLTMVVSKDNKQFTSVESCVDFFKGCVPDDARCLILGGQGVYKEALDKKLVDKMYLTDLSNVYKGPGDTHFPEVDWSEWERVDRAKMGTVDGFFDIWSRKITP